MKGAYLTGLGGRFEGWFILARRNVDQPPPAGQPQKSMAVLRETMREMIHIAFAILNADPPSHPNFSIA